MATIIKATELREEDTRAIEALLAEDAPCVLPKAARKVLVELVAAKHAGQVTIVSRDGELLTTTQAATILGISRPRVSQLVNRGALKSTLVGKHHRIALADVLEKKRRLDALEEMRIISYTQGFPL